MGRQAIDVGPPPPIRHHPFKCSSRANFLPPTYRCCSPHDKTAASCRSVTWPAPVPASCHGVTWPAPASCLCLLPQCYMACTGLLYEDPFHAHVLVQFAKDMLRAAASVRDPHSGGSVRIRVGIHCGRVMSGIVGRRGSRYCLFGDTVGGGRRGSRYCLFGDTVGGGGRGSCWVAGGRGGRPLLHARLPPACLPVSRSPSLPPGLLTRGLPPFPHASTQGNAASLCPSLLSFLTFAPSLPPPLSAPQVNTASRMESTGQPGAIQVRGGPGGYAGQGGHSQAHAGML